AEGEATPPPTVGGAGVGGARTDGSFDLSGGVRGVPGGGSASARVAAPVDASESSARVVASPAGLDGGEREGADVARILSEADVFVRYGMLERAAEHLG